MSIVKKPGCCFSLFFCGPESSGFSSLSLHDALPITISTTPVIAGDSFEMDAVGALRLSPLRRSRQRSEERFSRNAETDLVCRLLLEKKKNHQSPVAKESGAPLATSNASHRRTVPF